MNAIERFAKNFIQLQYEDLPQEAIEMAKKEVLDLIGVAIAGFSAPGVKELLEIITDWGGKKESQIILSSQKVPAPMAAQVNATMAHALDYDDVHDPAVMHPGVVIIPTCLAMAERRGQVDGREFITAVVLGVDMICRLALAVWPGYDPSSPEKMEKGFQSERVKQGWHLTTLMGHLASAGAAGRLLALDEDRMIHAFGIAYHQCSGNLQCRIEGAHTKRMGPGFAARSGIVSALMAEKGITGVKNCLEGEQGLYRMYFQGGYHSNSLIKDLGTYFEGLNVSIKPYPCCRGIHTYIDATLGLIQEQKVRPEEVEEIRLFSDEGGYYALCMPLETRIRPRNSVEAQFSIPWGVATALAKGKVGMEHFTESAIQDREILDVAEKIRVEIDHRLDRADRIPPAKIEIKTRQGQVFLKQVDSPLGSPERPMSFDDCVRKFKDCILQSPKRISERRIERMIEFIGEMEEVEDVGEIMKLLRL